MAIVVDDFQDAAGKWVKGYRVGVPQYITESGRMWDNMSMRCKAGGATQKKDESYIGCSMSDNFKDFQYFVNWHTNQAGYGLGHQLDKDLLLCGNKIYSEDYCVLIPSELNLFFGNKYKHKGDWPKGVHFHKASQKFVASLNINSRTTYLGLYQTPQEAALVYKTAKESEARRWAVRLENKEFVVDPRVIERMHTWEHVCDWKPQ